MGATSGTENMTETGTRKVEIRDSAPVFGPEHSAAAVRNAALAEIAAREASAVAPPESPEPPPKTKLPEFTADPNGVFLYIIRSADLVKIGYAGNLYLRLSNLKVNNPHGVELVAHYEMARDMAKEVERFVHRAFKVHSEGGEWFRVTVEQALARVQRVHVLLKELYEEAP